LQESEVLDPAATTTRAKTGALPNLIIIGAPKCGTTSLHNYLNAHPEIAMARVKEANFFLPEDGDDFMPPSNWGQGIDWYRTHFDATARIRGESSPNYTHLPRSAGVAERMRSIIPDARLIYLVRDPFARITSHYIHRCKAGRERRPFAEVLREQDSPYVQPSLYFTQLQPFLAAFSRDRILIESQERMLAQRRAVLRRIFGFLGVDDSVDRPEFDRLWEQSEGKGRLYTLALRTARAANTRRRPLPEFLRWPAQRILRARVTGGRRVDRPTFDPDLREQLSERLRTEVESLRQLTGLEFAEWTL